MRFSALIIINIHPITPFERPPAIAHHDRLRQEDISDIMYEYRSSQDRIVEENNALRQTVNQLMEEFRFFVIIEKPHVTGI